MINLYPRDQQDNKRTLINGLRISKKERKIKDYRTARMTQN